MRTILLVEDDATSRMIFRQALQRAGYRVIASPDAVDGLRALDLIPEIDAVITDIRLPGTQGFAFARIARHTYGERLRFLYYSGDRDCAQSPEAAEAFGRVIERPSDLAALVTEVDRLFHTLN